MPPRRAFVGRLRELEQIAGAFAGAQSGEGGLFLLVGGAGIGKTRLAAELAALAERRGLQPLWGRCWETGGAPAYWPWIQILREVARDRPAVQLREAAGPGAEAVAQLVPELGTPGGAFASGTDPAQARFRLFDAVTAVLRAASLSRPLLLVLDDLHAADRSSLALLHFLARHLRGLRAQVVGTYRDEDARLPPELADIAREGTPLPLAPLSRAEMGELVAGVTGQPPPPGLLDAVEQATDGNPLFLDHLLRLLVQRGELGAGGTWSPSAPLPIPDTAREVIGRRVARLNSETRELLDLASVVGRDAGLATLSSLAGRAATDTAARLEPAVTAGLLLVVEPAGYRFSHGLVREVVYRDLAPVRRAQLHLELAELLERGGQALAEIAHHRLAALPAGDPAALSSSAQRAAARAISMLAFEDAAVLLERARAGLAATARLDPDQAFELQLTAGLAFLSAGQGERGRALCAAAAAEARRLGDGARLARAALGYGGELMLAQSDPTLIALLEEALAAVPPEATGARAELMARLAAARLPADDAGPPLALARDAIAMARAPGTSPETLRRVLSFAGSALADDGDAAERVAIDQEMVALARAAGDQVQVLRGQARLVFGHLEVADVEQSQRALEAYARLAQQFGQPRHLWVASMMRAMYATAQGREEDARRLAAQARDLAASDGDLATGNVLAWHRLWQTIAFQRAGEADGALAELTESLRQPVFERHAQVVVDLGRAMLLARFSDESGAVQRALDVLPWASPLISADPRVAAGLVPAVAAAKDAGRARLLYALLRPHAGRIATSGRSGFACFGPVDGLLGLLARTMGARDEANQRLEQAIGLADRTGVRLCAADARRWIERAGAALDGRRGAPPAPAFSFVREGDYWSISAAAGVARIKDSRGMQMLAQLVAQPSRELHVLALMGCDGGAVDRGDAGELLDQDAIAAYRRRLNALDDDLAEAQRWTDTGRAARAQAERDALARELERAVGLGGRDRRAGVAAERARVNVQRRLRGAIRKLGDSLPELARYLDRAVKTGTFCRYEPW